MRRFFEGIHWLLAWIVIYVALYIFVVAKHPEQRDFWNMGAMVAAWLVTVVAMWIRSEL